MAVKFGSLLQWSVKDHEGREVCSLTIKDSAIHLTTSFIYPIKIDEARDLICVLEEAITSLVYTKAELAP